MTSSLSESASIVGIGPSSWLPHMIRHAESRGVWWQLQANGAAGGIGPFSWLPHMIRHAGSRGVSWQLQANGAAEEFVDGPWSSAVWSLFLN